MRGDYFAAGVIISIGAVLFVLACVYLDSGGIEYSDSNTWEYEDYVEMDGTVLGVSGSLEVVTVGDSQYIHAYTTGKGEVMHENGKRDKILVKPAKCDLIIMNGQSNAAYYDTSTTIPDPSQSIPPMIGTSFYFGTETGMPYHAAESPEGMTIHDFIDSNGDLRVGDKGPAFCKTYNEATGKKVIWLSLGIPAKRIAAWDIPNGSAWVQNIRIADAFNEALKDYYFDIEDTYLLWAQGESDYLHSTGYDHYIQTFKALYANASEAWGHEISQCYLICGRTAQVGWVNDCFYDLASQDPTIHVAVPASIIDSFSIMNGLMQDDDLHYRQPGDNAIGDGCARYAAKDLGFTASPVPIYLIEWHGTATRGGSVALPETATAYRTDGTTGLLAVTWDGTVDTSSTGTFRVDGTAVVSPSLILPHSPPAMAIVDVVTTITIDGLVYTVDGTDATVTGYTGAPTTLTIPTTISKSSQTWTVTAVGTSAFQDCTTITSADLGSISDVGNSAFYNCTSLQTVTAPDVIRIGSNGFRGCSALSSIDLPSATTLLGYCFNNCTSLQTVSIPSVTDIAGYVFRLCPATVEVTFGPLTGTVTESAFAAWTFYDTDGTTVLAKTAANLANSTFRGTASALVKEATA